MGGISVGVLTNLQVAPYLVFTGIAVYISLYYGEKKYFDATVLKSIVAWSVLFLSGILLVNIRTEKNNTHHFIHTLESVRYYEGLVLSQPEFTAKTSRMILEVTKIKTDSFQWRPSSGKIMVYIHKGADLKIGKGDVVLIKGKPSIPPAASNPEQFDYASYLSRQNVYAVHFLPANSFQKIAHQENSKLIQLADDFRSFCEAKLRAGIKQDNEYYLTVALLLGVKAGLDEKLYQAYSETGTVHALAVSGLHVSLIYFIVIFLFGFLKKIKYGKLLFACLSILVFWFYALVTGFSPSVVRAVTMFSVFLIAGILKRNAGIYNTLAFSAFLILCVEPFWLMDVGFQFSFLAVVGIAYLYPMLYGWWAPGNFLLDKLWSLICLSIAAQLAVSPLSIYYFHSFPLLFLPFNMLIVPLSSLALYTGLSGLIVYKIKFLSDLCLLATEYLVRLMNDLVQLPSGSDFLKIDFLYLTVTEVLLLYFFIILLFFSLKNKVYKNFVLSSACFIFFSISVLHNSITAFSQDVFTVYQAKGKTLISLIHGGNAIVMSDSILTKNDKIFRYNSYNHLAKERIHTLSFMTFSDTAVLAKTTYSYGQLIVWQGLKILRITRYPEEDLPFTIVNQIDYLIISDNDFYRRIQRSEIPLNAGIVIIDSSVGEKRSTKEGFFYSVNKRGAFMHRQERKSNAE